MKIILIITNLLFSFSIFAQENDRIHTFFNDTLKGKWILQDRCYVENCDTIGRNIEYLIFKSITPHNYVKFNTNGSWCTSKGDSAKLYLINNEFWRIDDFLFFDFEFTEIGIKFEKYNFFDKSEKLILISTTAGGALKTYIKDEYYSGIHSVINKSIKCFPNPFVDKINFTYNTPNSTDRIFINIFSSTGQLLRKIEITENGQSTKTIYLDDIKKGIYLGVVTINNMYFSKTKLVKE